MDQSEPLEALTLCRHIVALGAVLAAYVVAQIVVLVLLVRESRR